MFEIVERTARRGCHTWPHSIANFSSHLNVIRICSFCIVFEECYGLITRPLRHRLKVNSDTVGLCLGLDALELGQGQRHHVGT